MGPCVPRWRSYVLHLEPARCRQRVVGRSANADYVELMLGLAAPILPGEHRIDETGDQVTLRGGERGEVDWSRRGGRITAGMHPCPGVVVEERGPGPEHAKHMLVAVNGSEVRRDASDGA